MSSAEKMVLTLTRSALVSDGEDRRYNVAVAITEGKANSTDLMEVLLDAASALIIDVQHQTGAPLEDMLDDVWNRLADLVETAQMQGSDSVH